MIICGSIEAKDVINRSHFYFTSIHFCMYRLHQFIFSFLWKLDSFRSQSIWFMGDYWFGSLTDIWLVHDLRLFDRYDATSATDTRFAAFQYSRPHLLLHLWAIMDRSRDERTSVSFLIIYHWSVESSCPCLFLLFKSELDIFFLCSVKLSYY